MLLADASVSVFEAPAVEAQTTGGDLDNWRSDPFDIDDPWAEDEADEAAVEDGGSWYGLQTLGVSLGSIAMVGLAAQLESVHLGVLAAIGYYLGPAIIHLGHGRLGASLGSFLVHASAPLLGAGVFFLGAANENGPDGFPEKSVFASFMTVIVVGVAALAVDTAIFANPDFEKWVLPQLNYDGDQATAGLAVRF